VLGQYDPALLGKEAVTTGRLYLVAPNLEQARRQMSLPKDQFETWVVFHELTHSWQFEAHPWLREFMNQRVRELLVSASGKLAQIDAGELLRLAMRGELDVRQPHKLITGLMTPDQRRGFDEADERGESQPVPSRGVAQRARRRVGHPAILRAAPTHRPVHPVCPQGRNNALPLRQTSLYTCLRNRKSGHRRACCEQSDRASGVVLGGFSCKACRRKGPYRRWTTASPPDRQGRRRRREGSLVNPFTSAPLVTTTSCPPT
jgi:hypothetical protein